MRYEEITEVFVKPTDIQWQLERDDTEQVVYRAILPNHSKILLNAKAHGSEHQGGLWNITFAVMVENDWRMDIINSGNAATVIAAVIGCLREFMQKRKPDGLTFTADERSRQKLYNVLANKFATELGWKIQIFDAPRQNIQAKEYVVYRP